MIYSIFYRLKLAVLWRMLDEGIAQPTDLKPNQSISIVRFGKPIWSLRD